MMKILKWFVLVLVLGVVVFFVLRWLVVRASPMPDNLGVTDSRLAACPESPNCVSSYETDAEHGMAGMVYEGETAVSQANILAIIQAMPGNTLITNEPGYIHAEFRSPAWRFVDDVEFYFDEEAGLIQFRSASRLGYGDGGVNRRRMEAIQSAFEEGR